MWAVRKRSEAAIGASQFDGKVRSALLTKTGDGMISVTIESALMPGSKTPKPPAVQIHFWPGCQRRTSSFQVMVIAFTVSPWSRRRAWMTAGLYCECQVVKRTRPHSAAKNARSASSLTVAVGGFSSITCLPAASASRA